MTEEDEILDFDDNVDFGFSEDPANSNLPEGDVLFDLDAEMSVATDVQQTEASTEEKNKEISELTGLPENVELDDNSQQKDQEEIKFGEIDGFDMDPDFLNEGYGDVNVDDVAIEDDEFWKELGLDPPNETAKEENEKTTERSGTPDNFNIENTPKKSSSSQSDATKVNSARLDIPNNKSVKRTSKSPEKEDGEILNTSTSADNNRQGQQQLQKQKSSQQQAQTQRQPQTQRTQAQRQQQQSNPHQQQNLQNYRGRGGRRNNDWRPGNIGTFRSGFGPGLEGMPGMPIPLNNPPMMPNLNLPHGMIGPNIHVNPNFARLRPHALPFGNPMGQYPGPMNMMQYQGQMDMHPYHHSIAPMGSGRGSNSSYAGRGGSPGFNHNSISPRRPTSQQNNNQAQRSTQSSPKRKVPNDGFDQKEPDSKKASIANGKSPVLDAKPASVSQKNAEKSKAVSSPTTKNSSSPPATKTSNSKQGTIVNTNKTASAAAKNKIPPSSSNTSTSKQVPKPVQKPTPKNTVRNTPTKASASSSPKSKPTTKTDGAPSSGSKKLTIGNVVKNVTKRDIQDLANKVPIGFSSITFDRSAQTAEVVFETSEGAKMFRRMHNRSLLHGSNIVINFS